MIDVHAHSEFIVSMRSNSTVSFLPRAFQALACLGVFVFSWLRSRVTPVRSWGARCSLLALSCARICWLLVARFAKMYHECCNIVRSVIRTLQSQIRLSRGHLFYSMTFFYRSPSSSRHLVPCLYDDVLL